MGRKANGRHENLRRRLAHEAAKIIADQGITDYRLAKRKAAQRLGITDLAVLPKNAEVEKALEEHLRLFAGPSHPTRVRKLRETAFEVMSTLTDFHPRLVGPVLNGTATDHSLISLHLFAETAEAIAFVLMERRMSYRVTERRVRYFADRMERHPCFRFMIEDVEIEATVFPLVGMRQAPCSPIDGRPMRRASLSEVESLLAARGDLFF